MDTHYMSSTTPTGLLISVRSAEEALVALEHGADLIDVKDPSRGPLGAAHHEIVSAVLEAVGGAVPVSAALGEWTPNAITEAHWHLKLPLQFLKWGLAGYGNPAGWGEDLLETRRQVSASTEVVCVAYADWEAAKSLPPAELVKFAKRYRYRAFLFDTYAKNGQTLLDHLSIAELTEFVANLKRSQIAVALGGSLKLEQIKQVKPIGADWLAVRGAVCAGGTRDGLLDPVRIDKWKKAISA
jgi:(5-formylfuran-3-yl)methyl phosphate synthase